MTHGNSRGSSRKKKKKKKVKRASKRIASKALPVPQPPSTGGPILAHLKPGASAAEWFYRKTLCYAMIEARRLAQSDEEVAKLVQRIVAKIMTSLPIAEIAADLAQAKDPNIYLMKLRHDIGVNRYQRSLKTP